MDDAAATDDDNVEANEKRETRKSYSIIFNTKQKYVIIMQMEQSNTEKREIHG